MHSRDGTKQKQAALPVCSSTEARHAAANHSSAKVALGACSSVSACVACSDIPQAGGTCSPRGRAPQRSGRWALLAQAHVLSPQLQKFITWCMSNKQLCVCWLLCASQAAAVAPRPNGFLRAAEPNPEQAQALWRVSVLAANLQRPLLCMQVKTSICARAGNGAASVLNLYTWQVGAALCCKS